VDGPPEFPLQKSYTKCMSAYSALSISRRFLALSRPLAVESNVRRKRRLYEQRIMTL
jgi:hypothetical protein